MMEQDKENQEHQMLVRKAGMLDAGTPRTPFSEVNRQTAYGTDPTRVGLQPKQSVVKPGGKRRSWAPEGVLHRQTSGVNESFLTPPRSTARETPLRKQVLEKSEAARQGDVETSAPTSKAGEDVALFCSLPASPIMRLPQMETVSELFPVTSQSCPEIKMSANSMSLPTISESPPHSLGVSPSPSGFSQSESPIASPDINLLIECEDATQHSDQDVSCETDSEGEGPSSVSVREDAEDARASNEWGDKSESLGSVESISSLLSDEGISSGTESPGQKRCVGTESPDRHHTETESPDKHHTETESPDKHRTGTESPEDKHHPETELPEDKHCTGTESPAEKCHTVSCGETDGASLSDAIGTDLLSKESEAEPESFDIVGCVLEDLLLAVEKEVDRAASQHQPVENEGMTACQNSNQSANPTVPSEPHTYMAEYTKFVELYTEENSPAFPSLTSSLTDVTPCSQNSEIDADRIPGSCASGGAMVVVVDSLSSFLSDSDDSFSSSSTVQRQLTFQDMDMGSPSTHLDVSTGFVRSSESRFDLREESPSSSAQSEEGTDGGTFPESECLNLSVLDQKVEYLALPSSSSLLRHAPKIIQSRLRSVASSPIQQQSLDQSSSPVVEFAESSSEANIETCDFAASPFAVLVRDIQTMTVSAETASTLLSPIIVPSFEKSTVTETIETSEVNTSTVTVDTNSIALSPMPASVEEKQMNTSITETTDADTMTLVPTSDVALSPVAVAVREVNTMTTGTDTAEVGMTTEEVQCQDHSMLATADLDNKMTMTDSTGCRNVFTTMTPLKLLAKQGHRLTSDDIRKQHPRALANQLETLTVSNSRLESELRSAEQERRQLQGALKEAKRSAASKQAQIEAAEKQKQDEEKEKERKQLEQLCSEQKNKIATLEQELSALRAESEVAMQKQMEDLSALQAKCQGLEEDRVRMSQQHEQEIQDLKNCPETNAYRQQFEHAQQMLRENQAELSEVRGLFADLQMTAHKQEKVDSTYREIHSKILTLAKENCFLKDTLAKKAFLSKEREGLQAEVESLQQSNASLVEEVNSLKQTLVINNSNLSELEKLYSASSSDLLTATGRMVELNAELFAARKAMQDVVMSKEALARRVKELEDTLSAVQEDHTSLSATLEHTQQQLQRQSFVYEKLHVLSQKMKKIYEDKLENMALGVENLQRTLDSRELDIDNLEKDLYECRNIIVEQRYKIDGLESELREAKSIVAQEKEEEENIQFYKESNAFLEAERSVYVQSLRDLEEKLRVSSLELSQQQQVAAEAGKLAEELQEDKLRLMSELSAVRSQFLSASQALSTAKEEHNRAKSAAMATANDLLQHMQLMLAGLKKKVGFQEVPGLSVAESEPRPPLLLAQSKPAKSKRQSRKSFVAKILGAATEPNHSSLSTTVERGEDEWDRAETGSYAGSEASNVSVKEAQGRTDLLSPVGQRLANSRVKEVNVSSMDLSLRGPAVSRSDSGMANSFRGGASPQAAYPVSSHRELNSSHQSASASMMGSSAPRLGPTRSGAFTPVHCSSSSLPGLPPHSLLHPPSSEPPTSAFAKVRAIPKTKRRSEQPSSHRSPAMVEEDRKGDGGSGLVACVVALKEVFSDIVRLASILDRATQLSLHDLMEENDMLRERTEILEERLERNTAQLNICRQEAIAKDTAIAQLQQQSRERTEQLMAITDHKFDVKRLSAEVKRLEAQLAMERGEKEMLSAELETLFQRLERSTASTDEGATLARCMRDIITLKKKNQQLNARLEEERDHYEELGSKAARRMRVLDENWKKAEDEVYRLDELVENIKQIAESTSSSPNSNLSRILHLIEGESKASPP